MQNKTGQETVFPLDKTFPAHRQNDTTGVHYSDNTSMVYLHAASLLNNLRVRFFKNEIYVCGPTGARCTRRPPHVLTTACVRPSPRARVFHPFSTVLQTYTAHILCAINPFKDIPIYTDKYIQQYRNKSIGAEPPHVFAIGRRPRTCIFFRRAHALTRPRAVLAADRKFAQPTTPTAT